MTKYPTAEEVLGRLSLLVGSAQPIQQKTP
jgi:hypothetical protein